MKRIWLVAIVICWIGAIAHAAPVMTTSMNGTTFGTAHVLTASTTTRTITIHNDDAAATSPLTFTVASNTADYSAVPASGMIPAGNTLDVTITFTPQGRGTRNAMITVSGNDPANASDTFSVSGTGTSGNLVVTPSTVNFGTVAVAGGTAMQTITISNPAPANEPLMFSLDITNGGTDYAETDPAMNTLAVGASVAVTVTFNPTTTGTRTGVATVTANDAFNPSATVNLTGVGSGAVFTPSATSFDFGTIPVGSFAEQTLTITNTGNVSGTINSITSGNAAFTFTVAGGMPPRTLAPAASLQVTIRFTPVDGSIVMSNLTYTTDGTPASQAIALTGDGLSRTISITAMNETDLMIDLGDQRVGTAAMRHITVTNTGEGAVTVNTVSSNNAECVVQSVTPALPAMLTSTQTVTFDINTTPSAVGLGACTITVTTNIPTTDTIEIAFRGVAPEVALTQPQGGTLDFGVVDVDAATEVRTIVVTNTGTAPLAIGPCSIAGVSRYVVITSCTGLSIAPNATATLMVGFDPNLESAENSELTIGVDALSTSQIVIGLTGIGGDQHIDLSAMAVSFPDTPVGATDPPIQYIDVSNPRNPVTGVGQPLTISMATTDKEVFTLANEGPFTVEPGEAIRIAITFRPAAGTTYDGALVIANDASTPMAQVALHGRGIAAVETGGCCQGGPSSNAPLALCLLLVLRRRRRYF
jgi:large repetitive protein